MSDRITVATDWEIKFLPRHLYHGLIYFRDKYYRYKLKGKDSAKLKADYVNKLNTLFFSVETYFQVYIKEEKKNDDSLPDIAEYHKLTELPLPDDITLRRLETALISWLYIEGYFKTVDKTGKRYESIEEQYEDE